MENISLIDWRLVGFSALWVTGLAVVLSSVSFAYFEASDQQTKLRDRLGKPGYQQALNIGLMLFSLGMLGTAGIWWERVAWGLLAAAFAFYSWRAWQAKKNVP